VDSVKIINDRDTGRPRGFCFVEMPGSDAQNAIQQMNGFEMNGRPLRINEARERAARPPRAGGGGERWYAGDAPSGGRRPGEPLGTEAARTAAKS
jgi:RNA recognition motif-containing protein